MPDRYGRPTFEDGLNMVRSAMTIQGAQRQQKTFDEQDLSDKYFGMKLKGEEVPKGEGYSAKADLMADEMINRKWQAGQTKQIADTEEKLASMPDDQVLNYQPQTYAEHIVAAHRIKMIGSNEQNRQAINDLNKKKALEAYQYSTAAFTEARDKYARGDFKGASDELVKIGMITNNPFKVRPSDDGKTVELYFTKDGVDQPGQKYPIEQAMQIAQEHLNGEEFFQAHLQNREARKSLNESSLLNPIIFQKGNKELRAVRELDLNTNQVRWSVYDEKGNLHGGQPMNDIGQLMKEGWKRYDSKTADDALQREKLRSGIEKDRAEIDKMKEGDTTPKSWSKEWWPQTPGEKEGADTPITEARSIVAKAYDTSKKETKKLVSGQILPEYKRWVEQNKDQMVQGEDGQERPLNAQDLQNAFDHIAYDIIQKSQAKTTPQKTENKAKSSERTPASSEPKKEPAKMPEKKQKVTPAGTVDGFNIGMDEDGQTLIKDGKTWRQPKSRKEKIAVAKIADWRSKIRVESTEPDLRKPLRFY